MHKQHTFLANDDMLPMPSIQFNQNSTEIKASTSHIEDDKYSLPLVFPRLFIKSELQCLVAGFAGADTHHLLQIGYKDLAVTDLAAVRSFTDGLNH